MNHKNYYLLRSHGYLKDETFIVPDNFGFITFCKQGVSRKSELNDLLICILNKNLSNIRKNVYSEKEYIGSNINKIFINPEVNIKFQIYLFLLRSDLLLNNDDDFLSNFNISEEEKIRIFSDKTIYTKIIDDINSINKNDLPLVLNDLLKDNSNIINLFNEDLFTFELKESFKYLLDHVTKKSADNDKLIILLEKLNSMIKYIKFYGPESVIQNINFNIVGFYDSCNKPDKSYGKIKKSGLISFDYLSKADSDFFIKKIPCKYQVTKSQENLVDDIFYFEKVNGEIKLKIIDIFSSNFTIQNYDRKCDELFNSNNAYKKYLYYKLFLNKIAKNSNKTKYEDRYILIWKVNNNRGFRLTKDIKNLINKKNLQEEYIKIMEEVKIVFCNSVFLIYSFYYQIFEEENKINNNIRSKFLDNINDIITSFESNEDLKNMDITKPNNFIDLVKILKKIISDKSIEYRDYTKNSLLELINNNSLKPGIYLLPACKKGNVIDEEVKNINFF